MVVSERYAATRWQVFDPELAEYFGEAAKQVRQNMAGVSQTPVPAWLYFEQIYRWMAAGMGPEGALILMRMIWKAGHDLLHTVSLLSIAKETGLARSTVMKYKDLFVQIKIIRALDIVGVCYQYKFAAHSDMNRLIRENTGMLRRHRHNSSEAGPSGDALEILPGDTQAHQNNERDKPAHQNEEVLRSAQEKETTPAAGVGNVDSTAPANPP